MRQMTWRLARWMGACALVAALAACGGGGGDGGGATPSPSGLEAGTLRVHYQRPDAIYTNWAVYSWNGPTTPSTGTCRTCVGASGGAMWRNCSRMSGEALSRNQRTPSALTAADDCVRGRAFDGSVRAVRQPGHQQFHWGNPPPAAAPRKPASVRV